MPRNITRFLVTKKSHAKALRRKVTSNLNHKGHEGHKDAATQIENDYATVAIENDRTIGRQNDYFGGIASLRRFIASASDSISRCSQ
jgi:hypothetical protein